MLKICSCMVIFCSPKENFIIFLKEKGPSVTSEFAILSRQTCDKAFHVCISVTSMCVFRILQTSNMEETKSIFKQLLHAYDKCVCVCVCVCVCIRA